MSAISTQEFDTVRDMIDQRADEARYSQLVQKNEALLTKVQDKVSALQARFPDLALSPYMNTAYNVKQGTNEASSTTVAA